MQNPRARFGPGKPRLPQQTHPGLGLISDVISLMIVICERLKLDGIVFVPSHFHLALKARKHLHFLTVEDRKWFQAVEKAVEHIPLIQATTIVAEGGLRDRGSGDPVEWRPMPMVLALSDRMKQEIEHKDAKKKTTDADEGFEFEIRSDLSSQ
jgi:hypothetical protein